MRGENTFTFNKEMMEGIVQYYFDEVMFSKQSCPVIVGIETDTNFPPNFVIKTKGVKDHFVDSLAGKAKPKPTTIEE